jgi:hypothetical protein
LNVIDSAERRFEVMSRINRKLYSPEMHEVDATTLLRDLCEEDLRRIGGNERVVCKVGQSTATLSRERAMLLSLLVSELMLNATKHAFEPGQAGTIEISLEAKGHDFHFRGWEPASCRVWSLNCAGRCTREAVRPDRRDIWHPHSRTSSKRFQIADFRYSKRDNAELEDAGAVA